MREPVARYHPLLVVLHWLLVPAVVGNLAVAMLLLDGMDNTDPAKPGCCGCTWGLGCPSACCC
jgi:cytochrome b561